MVIVVVDAVWKLFMENDVHKQAESSATKFELFEEYDIQESISMSVMENRDNVLKRRSQDLGRFFEILITLEGVTGRAFFCS